MIAIKREKKKPRPLSPYSLPKFLNKIEFRLVMDWNRKKNGRKTKGQHSQRCCRIHKKKKSWKPNSHAGWNNKKKRIKGEPRCACNTWYRTIIKANNNRMAVVVLECNIWEAKKRFQILFSSSFYLFSSSIYSLVLTSDTNGKLMTALLPERKEKKRPNYSFRFFFFFLSMNNFLFVFCLLLFGPASILDMSAYD